GRPASSCGTSIRSRPRRSTGAPPPKVSKPGGRGAGDEGLKPPQLDPGELLRILLELPGQPDGDVALQLPARLLLRNLAEIDPSSGRPAVASALAAAADQAVHERARLGPRIGGADRQIEPVLKDAGAQRPGLRLEAQQQVGDL